MWLSQHHYYSYNAYNYKRSKKGGSTPSMSTQTTPLIFTGYYGVPNEPYQFKEYTKSRKWNFFSSSSNNKARLYQKPSIRSNHDTAFDRRSLHERYQNQKNAEREFNLIQYQINYVEYYLHFYPHLTSYYDSWLRQAKETLNNYTNIIESPDVLSFSSVYGYSKDEELITIYKQSNVG